MTIGLPPVRRRLAINLVLMVACGAIMFGLIFLAQDAIVEDKGSQVALDRMMPFYVSTAALMGVWCIGIIYLTVRDIRAERKGLEFQTEHEKLLESGHIHEKATKSILSTYQQLTYIDLENDSMQVIYAPFKPQFGKCRYSDILEMYKTHGAISSDDVDAFVETMSLENLRKVLAEEDFVEVKFRACHPGGTPESCIATASVIDRVDGVPTSAAFTVRSIHEVLAKDRANRDVLVAVAEQAEAASKAKNDFLSRASHDMRTPLNAIKGMTAIAHLNADDPDRVRESLEKINVSSDHLLEIIDEVLDISKIDSGRMALEEEPMDVKELVESVRVMLEPEAKKRGVSLRFTCDDIEHPRVMGDSAKLRELLTNIAGNSVKFTDSGGIVSLGVSELERESLGKRPFVFTVADNGIGMDEVFLKRLFEPFSRAEEAVVRNPEGTGLGMTIALNIARLMGGDVTVESEPGKGSCFKVNVYLEVLDDEGANEGIDIVEPSGASGLEDASRLSECNFEGRRALVVDDVDINAEIACELLRAAGMESSFAMNGAEAVEDILSKEPNHYDIVFMDVQMPVMDGHEAARAIRDAASDGRPDLSDLPIIAMTANAFADDARSARQSGMDGHIAKPVNLKVLKETLVKWLR